MSESNMTVDATTKQEIKEIVAIFMDLPKTDRAILLSNANAFKTLRSIERREDGYD